MLMEEKFDEIEEMKSVNMKEKLMEEWRRERRKVMLIKNDVDEEVYIENRVIVMEERKGRMDKIIKVDMKYKRKEEISI